VKKILKLSGLAAQFSAIVILFCGCSFISDFFGDGQTAAPTEHSQPDYEEPTPYPVIIDGVELNGSPEEIICLSPALCEILYEFGEGARLTGRNSYCDYPNGVKSVPAVGEGVGFDIEKIIVFSPDLLLSAAPVAAKDKMTLEREGIAVITIPAPKNLIEFKNIYRLMGVILHGAFTGEEEGERVFSEISRVCDNSDVIDFKNFVYITENLVPATGDTLESSVFSCFGNNLAKNGSGYVYDKENLLNTQPNVIFLNGEYDLDDLLADGIYSQLDAVLNGRVIIVDNVYFERPTARIVKLIAAVQTEYNFMKD
jgi:ABC-type Fe3+-hydroxamate transport system substrate-binding protein